MTTGAHRAYYNQAPDGTWAGGCKTCDTSWHGATEVEATSWCSGHDSAVACAEYRERMELEAERLKDTYA